MIQKHCHKCRMAIIMAVLFFCSCGGNALKNGVTAETAFEGVSNYCHSAYDWSIAEDNPSIMSLEMGEESNTEYQVVFRSYTGALVYFYVDKKSGTTRIVEYVPVLNVTEEAGTIDIYDYTGKENK